MNQHILFHLLKHLGVPFTSFYLNELTAGMPRSETLIGMSNILKEKYNIESVCLRVEKNDIMKLETPFIAQYDDSRNRFYLVTKVTSDQITFLNNGQKAALSISDFFIMWNGVVLLATPDERSGERNYRQNLRVELLKKARFPIIIALSSAVLFYFGRTNIFNLLSEGLVVTAILCSYFFGLIISGLLLSQSINKADSLVSKVCGAGGKGCSKILDGDASTIFGLVSWSEIGFLYFAGSFLTLLFTQHSMSILFVLSISALPYTFWSIYYQWRMARQWCPFCVSIQLLLWAIFFLYICLSSLSTLTFETTTLIPLIACFLSPALMLWLVLPYVKSYEESKATKVNLNGLKFSGPIFTSVLKLSTKVDSHDASTIYFGSTDSKFAITVVTDVTCRHCVKAHRHLKSLMELHKDVGLQVVFHIPKRKDDENMEKIRYLIGVYRHYELAVAENIFHKWYDKGLKDFKKFTALYPIPENIHGIDDEVSRHSEWIKEVKISGTPAFFINNHYLPRWYDATDLQYLVNILL